MSEIIIRYSRLKSARYMLGALLVFGIGVRMILWGEGKWYGWPFIMLGGVGMFGFIRMFFDRDPQIIINDKGIAIRERNMALIEWSDIDAVYWKPTRRGKYLAIVLSDPARFIKRRPHDKAWVIGGEISLYAHYCYDMSCNSIVDAATRKQWGDAVTMPEEVA